MWCVNRFMKWILYRFVLYLIHAILLFRALNILPKEMKQTKLQPSYFKEGLIRKNKNIKKVFLNNSNFYFKTNFRFTVRKIQPFWVRNSEILFFNLSLVKMYFYTKKFESTIHSLKDSDSSITNYWKLKTQHIRNYSFKVLITFPT